MDLFNIIVKGTIATYLIFAWLCVAIPLLICIYFTIHCLAMNILATLSIFLPILS